MKTIESLGDLKGKRVLVRSDFNVPLDADKNITDDGRIQAALPTLRTLLDAGAKVIITAHLGRPKGQVNPDYSLAPVAKRLAEVTGVKVTLAEDTVGESAKAAVAAAGDGEIVLLENVRFNAAETSKDDAEREAFAAELAALADVDGDGHNLSTGGLADPADGDGRVQASGVGQDDTVLVDAQWDHSSLRDDAAAAAPR